MKSSRIKIALLIDQSGSYDRGLIRGIINYSRLFPIFEFFIDAPEYTGSLNIDLITHKLRLWRPDFIVMNDIFLTPEYYSLGIPIMVTPSRKLIPNVINIIADDNIIGEMAAMYFINKGFKNLAFYGTDKIFWSKKRKYSFKSICCQSALAFFEFEALLNKDWPSNPERLSKWMKTLPLPVGILGCCDVFAMHLIEAAHIAGLMIPEDVAILGVDNDEFICELYDPPMSSIDQDPKSVGVDVVKYIYKYIKEGKQDNGLIVGSHYQIITRRSTDVYAIKDDQIKKALIYIKENAGNKNINVHDVVASTSLSRRVLEMRFRNVINRSILQEIRREKISIICQKLIQSNTPINEIAYIMGFSSVTALTNFFKSEMKITLSDYRKQFQFAL